MSAWSPTDGTDMNVMMKGASGRAASQPVRRFKDFMRTTRKSWSTRRRVVGKSEWTQGEANPRLVVTTLDGSGGTTVIDPAEQVQGLAASPAAAGQFIAAMAGFGGRHGSGLAISPFENWRGAPAVLAGPRFQVV